MTAAPAPLRRSSGGTAPQEVVLTRAELAGALGLLEPLHADLLLYLWAGHTDLHERLATALASLLSPPRPVAEWIGTRACCSAALREALSPTQCPACGGRGMRVERRELAQVGEVLLTDHEDHVCEACGGSGRKPQSESARRRACGLPVSRWRAWSARYEEALRLIGQMEGEGLEGLRRALR